MDILEFIKQMQEMYGEDAITTADKINRPEPKKEVKEIELFNEFNTRNPQADGGRIGFDGGGSPIQRLRQEIVDSMRPYAPDYVTEDQLQLVVKDITLDMTAEQAQESARANFIKLFSMAEGGRVGFKDAKLVIKPPLMTEEKQKASSSPLKKDYLGQLKDKRKVRTSTLNDAIEVRNIIIKNKGHVGNVDELARLLGLTLPGGKLDFKKAQLALDLALDSFDELKGFKLAGDKYKNIDKTKFRYLDMIAKSFANHNLSTDAFEAAAHLLPSNMGKLVDLGDKIYLEDPKDPKKPKQVLKSGFFDVGQRNITAEGKKFLVDRISTLTGQKFNLNQLNELILKTQKVRRLKGQEGAKLKKYVQMNQEIKNLADDSVIQDLLKGDLNRQTQEAILGRATELVGGDTSIASRRLFQMAEAMSDTTNKYKDLGVKLNNTKASKIIATGKQIGGVNNRYGMSSVLYDYYGNVVDKAIGSGEGQKFIGKYQQAIKNALDKGQSPDEIFSLTASARRGLSPYALFTQQLRTDVNSAIKGAFIDSELSKKHEQLQEIFKGKKYSQLKPAEKKAADKLVEDFEAIKKDALNQPTNPGAVRKGLIEQYGKDSIQYQTYKDTKKIPNNYKGPKPIYLTAAEKKNIQLPSFDLKNPPSKSIEGFATRFVKYPQIKEAFEKSYKDVGYSMKVTKNMKTQKEFLDNLVANSKLDKCIINRKADGGRIGFAYSNECIRDGLNETKKKAMAGDKKAARQLVETAEAAAKGGRLLKNVLGPGAILGEAVLDGAIIGNKVLGGKPLKQAWAESFLSYLDPRKYRGELDPMLMEKDRMLEQSGYKDVLKSGFAAQDQLSAANKAIEKRNIASARNRLDQYLPAAADAREQGARANLSAKIISDEAFQDASRLAQESIQGLEGKQKFDLGVLSVPQGRDADLMRRQKAMREMNELFPNYSNKEIDSILDFYGEKKPDNVTYDQISDFFKDEDKTRYFADNFRMEKAGGGLASLTDTIPPESGPMSEGLRSLYNNGRKL